MITEEEETGDCYQLSAELTEPSEIPLYAPGVTNQWTWKILYRVTWALFCLWRYRLGNRSRIVPQMWVPATTHLPIHIKGGGFDWREQPQRSRHAKDPSVCRLVKYVDVDICYRWVRGRSSLSRCQAWEVFLTLIDFLSFDLVLTCESKAPWITRLKSSQPHVALLLTR